jgi:hypothetical protein
MWPVSLREISLQKLWASLPYDGQGFAPGVADPALAHLRVWAALRFWKATPRWYRPLLICMARLAWGVACASHVRAYVRLQTLQSQTVRMLLADCLRSGARPNEALIWRRFFNLPGQQSGPHPLPGRALGVLLSRLGSAKEHRLVADKQAMAELLAVAGLPTPQLVEIVPAGHEINATSGHWSRPDLLFVKPRHGSAARGAMSGTDFLRRKPATAGSDDLLVQARLQPARELADLAACGAAPVLRITTAREPEGTAFVHSALLSISVPGESPRNFLTGHVWVPIDPATGFMGPGIRFSQADRRYLHLPWSQAPVADRAMPRLRDAIEMVLRATALYPGLPLMNWDVIVTEAGPVILEGNTCGDWILTNLSQVQRLETVALGPLLSRWAAIAENQC